MTTKENKMTSAPRGRGQKNETDKSEASESPRETTDKTTPSSGGGSARVVSDPGELLGDLTILDSMTIDDIGRQLDIFLSRDKKDREEVIKLSDMIVKRAWLVGKLLNKAKERLGHGKFGPWRKDNVLDKNDISERTALRYMRMAEITDLPGLLDSGRSLSELYLDLEILGPKVRIEVSDEPTSTQDTGGDGDGATNGETDKATDGVTNWETDGAASEGSGAPASGSGPAKVVPMNVSNVTLVDQALSLATKLQHLVRTGSRSEEIISENDYTQLILSLQTTKKLAHSWSNRDTKVSDPTGAEPEADDNVSMDGEEPDNRKCA